MMESVSKMREEFFGQIGFRGRALSERQRAKVGIEPGRRKATKPTARTAEDARPARF
jgi:hypothetical protein